MNIKTDCRHFDGYKPCAPHKQFGVHCDDCDHYDRTTERILILKLAAAGEVIRCTPILRYLKAHHPNASIVWMTEFGELIPDGWVDCVVEPTWQTAEWIKAQRWDRILSLDKDIFACALAKQCSAQAVKGFTLDDAGHIVAADGDSLHKWHTGIFDDLMKACTKHYIEEIFELCGWRFSGERYVLPNPEPTMLNPMQDGGPVVGLNTGAGGVWPTRIWPEAHFKDLIGQLQQHGSRTVLLGGPDEHDLNVRLARATGACYHGVKPLRQFLSVVDTCDIVVTSVTLALHVAIGLGKRVVLFNNIFNRHEFHLYGLGEILEPALPCLGCYKRRFDDGCPVSNCMEEIAVDSVLDAVIRQAKRSQTQPSTPSAQPA